MPAVLRPVMVLASTPPAAVVGGGGAPTTENVPYTTTRPFIIADFHNIATLTAAASTARLWKDVLGGGAFSAVSDATVWANAGDLTRAATLAPAQIVVAATDVLRVAFVAATGTTANGLGFTKLLPTAITGA